MAKYLYQAIFTKEENGQYSVNFPDVPQCFTCGDDLQDAYDAAQDVLCLRLYDIEESGGEVPVPSLDRIQTERPEDIVSLVECDTMEYRRMYDSKAIKKTLTIPAWLNTMAERADLNFSSILQNALKNELNL